MQTTGMSFVLVFIRAGDTTLSSIVRISEYSHWPQENDRNSEKTRWQGMYLTFRLLSRRQIERDQRHYTATLVALSPPDLPPWTEQSIEWVQRNRQRGNVGPFHDHFGELCGSVVSEKCSTGFDNQASVVQAICVSKEMRMGWNHTSPANGREFHGDLSEQGDCWNWFVWNWTLRDSSPKNEYSVNIYSPWFCFFLLLNMKEGILKNVCSQTVDRSHWLPL